MEGALVPPLPPPPPPIHYPDQEEEPVIPSELKILVPDKGCGGPKLTYLQKHFEHCQVAKVPEPTDDLEGGVTILTEAITSNQPHVLIASSRGGKFIAELIQRGIWKGPTLLISAMSTSRCCIEGIPMILAHGVNDGTNPIHRVREDVEMGTAGLIQLREFDADHSLSPITEGDTLKNLVEEVYQLGRKARAEGSQGAAGGSAKKKTADLVDARNAMFLAIQARKKD